ncbi:MAG: hypothetical protein V9G23_17055, partial [Giesbergeria sp.]
MTLEVLPRDPAVPVRTAPVRGLGPFCLDLRCLPGVMLAARPIKSWRLAFLQQPVASLSLWHFPGPPTSWQERLDFLGYTFGRCYNRETGHAYIGTRPSPKSISQTK